MSSWRARGGVKKDKTDEVFSDLVRERTDFTCEKCLRNFRHDPASLHCSHIFGRAKKGVRWHPDNAMAHCNGCHDYLGQHPPLMTELAIKVLGQDRYNRLLVLANKPTKFTAFDKEIIHRHLLDERKRLRAERKEGKRGRIEFTWPATSGWIY